MSKKPLGLVDIAEGFGAVPVIALVKVVEIAEDLKAGRWEKYRLQNGAQAQANRQGTAKALLARDPDIELAMARGAQDKTGIKRKPRKVYTVQTSRITLPVTIKKITPRTANTGQAVHER